MLAEQCRLITKQHSPLSSRE